jgi:hypothetical protein
MKTLGILSCASHAEPASAARQTSHFAELIEFTSESRPESTFVSPWPRTCPQTARPKQKGGSLSATALPVPCNVIG